MSYYANVTCNYLTPSSSSSAMSCKVIDDSSPPTEEDDSNGNYISDNCSDSNSDDSDSVLSSQDPLTLNKTNPLALLERIPLITDVDPACVKEILADHALYPPIHNDGDWKDCTATRETLDYFFKVLSLRMTKYSKLDGCKIPESLRPIPLALSCKSFIIFYWPGAVICCKKLFKSPITYSSHFYKLHKPQVLDYESDSSSDESDSSSDGMLIHEGATEQKGKTPKPFGLIRENLNSLERHVSRSHRPPKPPPNLELVSSSPPTPPVSDDSEGAAVSHKANSSKSDSSKYPPGFEDDQEHFPPQHKPGDSEDFLANQDCIDYFVQALSVKWEKYSHLAPLKGEPLSSAFSEFVLHYWPGMMSCCDKVYTTCESFHLHLTTSHLPSKKIPQLIVVDQSAIPQSHVPEPSGSNPDPIRTDSPIPHLSSPRTRRNSRLANDSDQSQYLSILNTPSHLLRVNAVQQEARQLRIQATQVTIVSELLPMLERLFELSSSIITGLRGSMEVEARSPAVECLIYVWNASKMAIMRWVDINGCTTRDPFLTAVQYAYGTLPVFTNLEQNKHLEMIENVIVLSVNAVKNWEPAPSSPEAKKVNRPSVRRRTVKQMRTEAATQEPPVASSSSATHTPKEATSSQNMEQIKEFCRLANISVWQNTRARILTGNKDDQGRNNVVYLYGIAQMLKLYCPSGVTHLKCSDELSDLANLRVHFSKLHEGFHPDRMEPPISSA